MEKLTTDASHEGRTFDDAWREAELAEGWLTMAQGHALFEAARGVTTGSWIVEIGSHCGRSTVLLAAAKAKGVGVLAVDPFDDPRWGGGPDALTDFESTLRRAGLLETVETFRGISEDASRTWNRGRIGMLFVDGAHDRASVLKDIDGWAPHLAPRATVLFHDAYSSPGVTLALFERYFGGAEFEYLGTVGSLARLRKTRLKGILRLRSSLRMLADIPWFGRNLAVKVAIRRRWSLLQRVLRHEGSVFPY
jgi:predicted O-methyltransferase YrrM